MCSVCAVGCLLRAAVRMTTIGPIWHGRPLASRQLGIFDVVVLVLHHHDLWCVLVKGLMCPDCTYYYLFLVHIHSYLKLIWSVDGILTMFISIWFQIIKPSSTSWILRLFHIWAGNESKYHIRMIVIYEHICIENNSIMYNLALWLIWYDESHDSHIGSMFAEQVGLLFRIRLCLRKISGF